MQSCKTSTLQSGKVEHEQKTAGIGYSTPLRELCRARIDESRISVYDIDTERKILLFLGNDEGREEVEEISRIQGSAA
jgi:hypothetical protein